MPKPLLTRFTLIFAVSPPVSKLKNSILGHDDCSDNDSIDKLCSPQELMKSVQRKLEQEKPKSVSKRKMKAEKTKTSPKKTSKIQE